jgi:hypothetical protein
MHLQGQGGGHGKFAVLFAIMRIIIINIYILSERGIECKRFLRAISCAPRFFERGAPTFVAESTVTYSK